VASAVAALEVADDIRDGDARMTEAVVNQLIRWVVEINWPGAAAPRWELRAAERVDKTRAERDKLLTEAGVTFSPAYWQRSYNLSPEDLAAAPEPAAPTEPVALAAPAAAADAAPVPDVDPAVLARLTAQGQAAVRGLLDQVRAILAAAGSMEEAAALLEAAYPRLDAAPLAAALAEGRLVAYLAGRADVVDEVAADD